MTEWSIVIVLKTIVHFVPWVRILLLLILIFLCLDSSVVEHWSEKPCVDGSIPSLGDFYFSVYSSIG